MPRIEIFENVKFVKVKLFRKSREIERGTIGNKRL